MTVAMTIALSVTVFANLLLANRSNSAGSDQPPDERPDHPTGFEFTSEKRGQNYFPLCPARSPSTFLGRPRGRMVRSSSSRFASRFTHAASPYGSPVLLDRRIAASFASSIGSCTFSAHFRCRTFASGDSSS